MFVHPRFTRRGIGRELLRRVETAARVEGFRTLELLSTLSGEALYLRAGLRRDGVERIALPDDVALTALRMSKPIAREPMRAVASWPVALWTSYVFLGSLPYRFTNHPDTQHIFSAIGEWLGSLLGGGLGAAFTRCGAYAVGSLGLLTSLALLAPAALWLPGKANERRIGPSRATLRAAGGLAAGALMAGAVFFHLASPLGIVVLHEGQSGGGSLFFAATSILVLGLGMSAASESSDVTLFTRRRRPSSSRCSPCRSPSGTSAA